MIRPVDLGKFLYILSSVILCCTSGNLPERKENLIFSMIFKSENEDY